MWKWADLNLKHTLYLGVNICVACNAYLCCPWTVSVGVFSFALGMPSAILCVTSFTSEILLLNIDIGSGWLLSYRSKSWNWTWKKIGNGIPNCFLRQCFRLCLCGTIFCPGTCWSTNRTTYQYICICCNYPYQVSRALLVWKNTETPLSGTNQLLLYNF